MQEELQADETGEQPVVGLLAGEPGEEEEELAEVRVVIGEAVALAAMESLASKKKMQQLAEEAGHYI